MLVLVFGLGILTGFLIDWLLDVRYHRKLVKAIRRAQNGI